MRRIAALLAVPLLFVSAAACGDESSSKPGGFPAVSGEFGKKPVLEKGEGDPPKDLKVKVLKEGDGKKLENGDILTTDYLGRVYGGEEFDNSYDRGQPLEFPLGAGQMIKGWDEALPGQKVGSRVELIIPPDKGYGDQEKDTIPANSTLVFVVDIKKAVSTKPDGKEVPQEDPDLPKVGANTDGKAPKVTIPKGKDAPDEVVSKPIIQGTGKEVGADDTLTVHSSLTLWDGQPGVDSWAQGAPQQITVAQAPGLKEGLVGQKVGSRVMVVVPRDELSEEQRKQIKSDLVFVVDILAVN